MQSVLRLAKELYHYLSFASPERGVSRYRGVYQSFAEAAAAAPRGTRLGYDHQALAAQYRDELKLEIAACEYAVLYHLARIVAGLDRAVVLDFGGNVGTHFLRYRGRLPEDRLKWIVWDVPAIAAAGRAACAGAANVSFISDLAELDEPGVDVLLASGAIQYAEAFAAPHLLVESVMRRSGPPQHVLIDALTVHEGPRFVTLQNGGPVFYPEYVYDRGATIASLTALGYELDDVWEAEGGALSIPFHRDKTFVQMGLHLRKR